MKYVCKKFSKIQKIKNMWEKWNKRGGLGKTI